MHVLCILCVALIEGLEFHGCHPFPCCMQSLNLAGNQLQGPLPAEWLLSSTAFPRCLACLPACLPACPPARAFRLLVCFLVWFPLLFHALQPCDHGSQRQSSGGFTSKRFASWGSFDQQQKHHPPITARPGTCRLWPHGEAACPLDQCSPVSWSEGAVPQGVRRLLLPLLPPPPLSLPLPPLLLCQTIRKTLRC